MDRNKFSTLINLLDDPDRFVYQEVSKNLVNLGEDIIPDLEKSWENSINDIVQKRIQKIIKQIHFEGIKTEFVKWMNSDEQDIIEGAFWIAKYHYPDIRLLEIKYFLEDIAKKIWLEIDYKNTALEKVKIINYFIYKEFKFIGNIEEPKSPSNYHINEVIERRKGSPILLAIIYLWIANRLNLPVFGVNLPYNTILTYMKDPLLNFQNNQNYQVKFYINPYNQGTIIHKKEIDNFLEKIDLPKHDKFYAPCTNVEIIGTLLNELVFIYKKTDNFERLNHLKMLVELTNSEI
ncbi:MAG: transglutaminase family protein [Bacteroidales bacterium]|nr:transglutaminase family protein [Bacteroidales bacterium]